MLTTEPAFYVGTSRYSFRPGQAALIRKVVFVTPPRLPIGPCFEVEYPDGVVDYAPISDTSHYKIIQLDDELPKAEF